MKKQYISIFLLFLLVTPAVVTYSWLQHRKRAVKKEVKRNMIAGIDKRELVLLKFANNELAEKVHWEHAKEFEYNHQMYDVVAVKVSRDSVQYWCWWDFEETKLSKQLDDLLRTVVQNDVPIKEKQHQIYSFYTSFYFQLGASWKPIIPKIPKAKITLSPTFYQAVYFINHSPPPEIVSFVYSRSNFCNSIYKNNLLC